MIRRAVLALLVFVLAVHLWAFGHAVLPVRGTLNMVDRPDGTALQREWVPIERIAPHLVHAVIAAEDSRFCQHTGIDLQTVRDVMEERERGSSRGGSTLTQQTAKNVFFWNGGGWVRKAGEAWMSLLIDSVWGKRRVLEVYLNTAEWGDGVFGAEAAARARFNKPAADLTPREAALLAAVLPSPNKWRVDPPGPYVRERAATLQGRAATVRAEGLAACAGLAP